MPSHPPLGQLGEHLVVERAGRIPPGRVRPELALRELARQRLDLELLAGERHPTRLPPSW